MKTERLPLTISTCVIALSYISIQVLIQFFLLSPSPSPSFVISLPSTRFFPIQHKRGHPASMVATVVAHEMGHNLNMQHDDGSKSRV